MKKHLGLLLRVVVSAGLLAFAFSRVPLWDQVTLVSGEAVQGRIEHNDGDRVLLKTREGVSREFLAAEVRGGISQGVQAGVIPVFERIRWVHVVSPFLLMGILNLMVAVRWRMLAGAIGCPISLRSAYELVMIGLFLSMLLPGSTGGDIARAVFVSKGREDKAKPVLAIFVDRVLGIMGLVVLACGAVLFSWGDARFATARGVVLAVALLSAGAAIFFLSGRARSLVGWDVLLRRLPMGGFLAKVDEALMAYRKSLPTLGIALALAAGIHVLLVVSHWFYAKALSVEGASLSDFMVLIPVLTSVRAVPITMGGLGVTEVAAQHLLDVAGIPAAQAMAISLLIYISNFAWSLLGGIFLLFARHRMEVKST